MRIEGIIWLEEIVDKLLRKHHVTVEEVEEVLADNPRIFFVEAGHREGEDIYLALGRTDAGRYLIVLFVYKTSADALILSARDMTRRERRRYGRK